MQATAAEAQSVRRLATDCQSTFSRFPVFTQFKYVTW